MKLSEWARKNCVTYRTAYSLYRDGKIRDAYSLGSGTIVVPDESLKVKDDYIVTYARVSSSENKSNLVTQSKRLCDYCAAKGWIISESISEIGSGLNDKRPKLMKLFKDDKVTKIIVEHKDRLTRFGFEYIKILFNGELIVINETETEKEDLIQDFVSVITSFCARLYGQRRSKRKTEKLIRELQSDNSDDS